MSPTRISSFEAEETVPPPSPHNHLSSESLANCRFCVSARATCSANLRCVDCINPAFKNDHIICGYRYDQSWWEATKSLFSLHNETFNVWTHLVGFCIFLYLLYWTLFLNPSLPDKIAELRGALPHLDQLLSSPHLDQLAAARQRWAVLTDDYFSDTQSKISAYLGDLEAAARDFAASMRAHGEEVGNAASQLVADSQHRIAAQSSERWGALTQRMAEAYARLQLGIDEFSSLASQKMPDSPPTWPLITYLLACKICLGCSTIFHLYCSVKGDHILSWTCKLDYAGISVLIAGSYVPVIWYISHLGNWRFVYIGLAFALCLLCTAFTLTDATSAPRWRPIRTLMYICFGAFGLIPTSHAISIFGLDHPFVGPIFHRIAVMCCIYVSGALLYLSRIPERFSPGKFDVWFHSHQFWHIFVIVAALTHYTAAQDLWHLSHFFFQHYA